MEPSGSFLIHPLFNGIVGSERLSPDVAFVAHGVSGVIEGDLGGTLWGILLLDESFKLFYFVFGLVSDLGWTVKQIWDCGGEQFVEDVELHGSWVWIFSFWKVIITVFGFGLNPNQSIKKIIN